MTVFSPPSIETAGNAVHNVVIVDSAAPLMGSLDKTSQRVARSIECTKAPAHETGL